MAVVSELIRWYPVAAVGRWAVVPIMFLNAPDLRLVEGGVLHKQVVAEDGDEGEAHVATLAWEASGEGDGVGRCRHDSLIIGGGCTTDAIVNA